MPILQFPISMRYKFAPQYIRREPAIHAPQLRLALRARDAAVFFIDGTRYAYFTPPTPPFVAAALPARRTRLTLATVLPPTWS